MTPDFSQCRNLIDTPIGWASWSAFDQPQPLSRETLPL